MDFKVIVSNIIGGLGNQMFQYACGRAVSHRLGQDLYIASDQFQNYSLHNGLELSRVFDLKTKEVPRLELKSLLGWQSDPKIRYVLGRPAMRWLTGGNWYSEPSFQYWQGLNSIVDNAYIHGYWQSEFYFKDIANIIKNDFTFRVLRDQLDDPVIFKMRESPSVSIHVRRGDYLSLKNRRIYALCNFDYFDRAIELIRQKIPNCKLFFFTDDPDWVEANFRPKFGSFDIVRHNSGSRSHRDMYLMSNADHHIISNSTFSWWGAWLNSSPQKIVIAPTRWFLNGTNDKDLVPSEWLRI